MVLFDQSLKLVAFDRGAAAILNYPYLDGQQGLARAIPREVWDLLGGRKSRKTRSDVTKRLRSGDSEYLCRAYFVEPSSGNAAKPYVALHLQRISSGNDVVEDVALRFHLTEREKEVLSGISLGFTSNEIAEKLNISPHTVRSFFRLIMIKMGVTTRSGMLAALLPQGAG